MKSSLVLIILVLLVAATQPVAAADVFLPLVSGAPASVPAAVYPVFDNGNGPAIAIGRDGLPIISFHESQCVPPVTDCVRVAHCLDRTCANLAIGPVLDQGWRTNIAVGPDGLPFISYIDLLLDSGRAVAKLARCADATCSKASSTTLLTSQSFVETALAVSTDGLPIIVVTGSSAGSSLQIIHCADLDCTKTTATGLNDATFEAGAVAIGADGLPIIAYATGAGINFIKCNDKTCSTYSQNLIAQGKLNASPSLAVGDDGLPIIAYQDGSTTPPTVGAQSAFAPCQDGACPHLIIDPEPIWKLKVAHCADVQCAAVTTTLVDGASLIKDQPSIAIGADGLPLMAYVEFEPEYGMKLAYCQDRGCTTSNLRRWPGVLSAPSLTRGEDNLPIVAFNDGSGISVARCNDRQCTPPAVAQR